MLSRLEFRAEFGLEAFAEVRNLEVWPFGFSNAGVRSAGLQLFQSSLACGVSVHTVAVGVLAVFMKSAVNILADG